MNRPFRLDLVYLFWRPVVTMAVVEIATLFLRLPAFVVFIVSATTFVAVFFASLRLPLSGDGNQPPG